MCVCNCVRLVKWVSIMVVAGAIFIAGVNYWLDNKSYVFQADDIARLTNEALTATKGKGHNETYQVMEKLLRKHYPSHILPPSQLEWIYVNAGGWMGAMYILHAGVTEYLMFFGTAIDTSGHSGRYWAEFTDTIISGKFVQWKEGTIHADVYHPGDTVFHGVGETAAVQWTAPLWAVEYGRGFIPSALGFALSDTVFSTQDFVVMYKTIKIYTIALFYEWYNTLF